jgi:hypothetical protein
VPERVLKLGQFLDYEERLKPTRARALMANLAAIDVTAPWTAFPLRALRLTAPIDCFYEF